MTRILGASFITSFVQLTREEVNMKLPEPTINAAVKFLRLKSTLDSIENLDENWEDCCWKDVFFYMKYKVCEDRRLIILDGGVYRKVKGCAIETMSGSVQFRAQTQCRRI